MNTDGHRFLLAFFAVAALAIAPLMAGEPPPGRTPGAGDRWALGEGQSIVWNVAEDGRLPHEDFIEQSGRRVSQVVTYSVAADGTLAVKRSVVWPSLRILPNDTFGSLIRAWGNEAQPAITIDGAPLGPVRVRSIAIDGTLEIQGMAGAIDIRRIEFPATNAPAAFDRWHLKNAGAKAVTIAVAPFKLAQTVRGPYGANVVEVMHDAPATKNLAPGEELTFVVTFSGRLDSEAAVSLDAAGEEVKRRAFVHTLGESLRLETPDPVLDRAFAMAKVRAAESIYATRGGLMLGPGGLRYYAAVWCNDNVEYAAPFFPFLGDAGGNDASLNTFRLYGKYMGADYRPIPSSIIAEGTGIWGGAGDRGDAAMYAYGAARFCLARGDRGVAQELWPAIEWCLEYCRRKTTADGVVASDTDELEGRFPAGKANLSTSCLAYGGLRSAADLGRALGRAVEAKDFDARADALAASIERCFGAKVEGFDTYRYYEGNDVLRSWISLPLCMGLTNRRDATVAALFSPRLWTADGLATRAGEHTFWDRETLYGLRGVLQAGETEMAMPRLTDWSHRRLLGEHVPYAVEAFPEGGKSHLSAESALYCRVYIEGLLGIRPTALDAFKCAPRLPNGWDRMALRSIRAFGREFDLIIERAGAGTRVTVQMVGQPVLRKLIAAGEEAEFTLPPG
ncbi:MAG TPA: hypothetical protein VG269_10930 [Tepidisphaeraceae bacterium]|jgi:hypothetical protein|nr:hypothetical protein [Tepidisphaeraceae bacterium]